IFKYKNLVSSLKTITFLSLTPIRGPSYYSRMGLHFNLTGKRVFVQLLFKSIQEVLELGFSTSSVATHVGTQDALHSTQCQVVSQPLPTPVSISGQNSCLPSANSPQLASHDSDTLPLPRIPSRTDKPFLEKSAANEMVT
ncbi:hypothetical protein J6590_106666, partial [Homalodisca vitripennis]